ncbi:alpha/beta hydrolase [Sphingobacterium faecale]|uniref:Alpha/beta hydrolase n=1 Tax=Sphingobacterium faecale TaxID=2803775 RepID=A0ABS1QYI7_9SPHI|nr:alpha/beta hydrolase-fold protein [Sphingobacterium faecale]MBL1407483.1 alpha/beta hydrolase [Sphingobacterium faecale]
MTSKKTLSFLINIFFIGLTFAQFKSTPLTIGKSDYIHSKILNEKRTLNIYLPEEYNAQNTVKYPVIYVLDGGKEEDWLHVAGTVHFNTQPWIARFPRSIVIGIEGNTRRRDFTFAVENTDFIEKEGFQKSSFPHYGGSGKFIDFIQEELQPYINRSYKTGSRNTIIGESLAGLLTTEILLNRSDLFDDYIIISPSLWWGERILLKNAEQLLKQNLKKKVNIYLGVPNREEDTKMYLEAESLYNILRNNKDTNIVFDYMPEETHATVIHQAVYNAFKKLYTKTTYGQ